MVHGIIYAKSEVQNPALHLIELLRVLQKLQINYFSKTSLNGYFKLRSDISFKSVPQQGWKNRRANRGAKHKKAFFFIWFQQL